MNHTEYITARNRNLLTLLELGLDANKLYPKLSATTSQPWQFKDQLWAMSEKIDSIRARHDNRVKN